MKLSGLRVACARFVASLLSDMSEHCADDVLLQRRVRELEKELHDARLRLAAAKLVGPSLASGALLPTHDVAVPVGSSPSGAHGTRDKVTSQLRHMTRSTHAVHIIERLMVQRSAVQPTGESPGGVHDQSQSTRRNKDAGLCTSASPPPPPPPLPTRLPPLASAAADVRRAVAVDPTLVAPPPSRQQRHLPSSALLGNLQPPTTTLRPTDSELLRNGGVRRVRRQAREKLTAPEAPSASSRQQQTKRTDSVGPNPDLAVAREHRGLAGRQATAATRAAVQRAALVLVQLFVRAALSQRIRAALAPCFRRIVDQHARRAALPAAATIASHAGDATSVTLVGGVEAVSHADLQRYLVGMREVQRRGVTVIHAATLVQALLRRRAAQHFRNERKLARAWYIARALRSL